MHARGARGSHFLQGRVCTQPVLSDVVNVTPKDRLQQSLGIRGQLIFNTWRTSSQTPGPQPRNTCRRNAQFHYDSADPGGNSRVILDVQESRTRKMESCQLTMASLSGLRSGAAANSSSHAQHLTTRLPFTPYRYTAQTPSSWAISTVSWYTKDNPSPSSVD